MKLNHDAIESARSAGLSDGSDQSNAYISGYEAGVADMIASDKITSDTRIEMFVNRFLAWPLPPSVCADPIATQRNPRFERSGTTLLTADEARQMFEYVLKTNS